MYIDIFDMYIDKYMYYTFDYMCVYLETILAPRSCVLLYQETVATQEGCSPSLRGDGSLALHWYSTY